MENDIKIVEEKMPEQVGVPKGIKGYVTNLGPGLVLAMTFLGTGDLVSSSVSGANYGYTLLWSLMLALAARTFIVSSIAKYTLFNRFGDTSIIRGYGRVWKFFPPFLGVMIMIVGFTAQMSLVRAAAVSIYRILGGNWAGEWGVTICGIAVMGVTFLMMVSGKQYKWLEILARSSAFIIITFFVIAIIKLGRFDIVEFAKGMVFSMPPQQSGLFAAIVVAVSTIGSVAGSSMNLLYPGFMKEKGWTDARYRKVQTIDLISGMIPLFVINMLFWVVAAESTWRVGGTLSTEQDLANMMYGIMGPVGPTMLWICLFLAVFSDMPTQAYGITQLALDGINIGSGRDKKIGEVEKDPWFKRIQVGLYMILPLISTLPNAPDLIILNVLGTSVVTSLILPFIVVGLIFMTSSKKYLKDYAVNKWWEVIILVILGAIAFWSTFEILRNFAMNWAMLFN